MTNRMSVKEYNDIVSGNKGKSKYKNKRVRVDGILFDSKAEAAYYGYLLLLKKACEVSYFLMQVPFLLEGGVKYRLDFMVFYSCGRIENIDVKGVVTELFRVKKKMVEARYPVKIRCLKRHGNKFIQIDV